MKRTPMPILVPTLLALVLGLFAKPSVAWPPDASGSDSPAPRPVVVSEPPIASLDYYLGQDSIPGGDYDPAIPTPASVLGWEVGTWHVRHDQLIETCRRLAAASDRITLEVIGRTHEQRPLIQLTITSPRNHARLDAIRAQHAELSDPRSPRPDFADLPAIVNLGYSIHGNEPSGSNAALVVAYHLAAARGEEIESWLDDLVIVLDPSLNPDGLSRFAQWANMHRGRIPVADGRHREHVEGWPNGRTNHYWFDLNRDWLLAQHPESQARLASFHRWRPNVLTDFHEMGTRSTYFFQPGVPSRKNPLTPERNVELTQRFAEAHGKALDAAGSLYFTEELFDDFYYGKGSTYPDLQGAVGILFEQASSRGHLQESPNGPVAFPFTIRNQVLTSFSTLRAAVEMREGLLDYRADFFEQAFEQADDFDFLGWVVGDDEDPVRAHLFLELLRRHQIEVHALERDLDLGSNQYAAGRSWFVPLAQPQSKLVRTLFERRVDFPDTTFYDVSTWTAPLAYALPYDALSSAVVSSRGRSTPLWSAEPLAAHEFPSMEIATAEPDTPGADKPVLARVFEWDAYFAPRALERLLLAGARARVATRPFRSDVAGERVAFGRGSIVVPMGIQTVPAEALEPIWRAIAEHDGIRVHALTEGLTPDGIDLGSPSLRPVELPRPALIVGRGVDTYAAGEIWHLLDHHFGVPLPLLDLEDLRPRDLKRYTHLLLVDGSYNRFTPEVVEELRAWVREGGVLVTNQRATRWAVRNIRSQEPQAARRGPGTTPSADVQPSSAVPSAAPHRAAGEPETLERRPYSEYRNDQAQQLVSGTIFTIDLDRTHPLAYGYRSSRLPVFRNHKVVLEPVKDAYAHVGVYSSEPLLSGYVSSENLAKIRNSPAVIAQKLGRGALIQLADDSNFRAYWHATHKLYLNALFFGPILDDTTRPPREDH